MIIDYVKLVIWDLDETFWTGTLSEGNVQISPKNIELIRVLTNRGIMNSICSKNDFEVVKNELEKYKIWDYFIFPHINWDDKGRQIKDIIADCNLRPINCLFIDDNLHNLNEAKYELPDIQIATPDIIETLFDNQYLQGKNDLNHDRLKQYKMLEKKLSVRKSYSSNEEFLYASEIKIQIISDCNKYVDRIAELIERTNQLNYTKLRISKDELKIILNDSNYKNGCVRVIDKFGDYGIVGYFCLFEGTAIHFLFSCRTIGIGVEQYVYKLLNCPSINYVGDTITELNNEDFPKWIEQVDYVEPCIGTLTNNIKKRILIRGGCDLMQMEPYISGTIKKEFNFERYHRDHTVFAVDSLLADEKTQKELIEKIPFLYKNSFETEIWGENDVVVCSLLMDYVQAIFQYKGNQNIRVAWGDFDNPLTKNNLTSFSEKSLEWFFSNFTLIGRSPKLFKENLEFIYANLHEGTQLILINGCEINHENPNEPQRYLVHCEMNKIVDDFVAKHKNVKLLDMRNIVKSRDDLTDNIRHYSREIYFKMAQKLVEIVSE